MREQQSGAVSRRVCGRGIDTDRDVTRGLRHPGSAPRQHGAANDGSRNTGQNHGLALPAEQVEVYNIAFARAGDGLARLPGSAARAIDGIAIFGQPGAHCLQPPDLSRLDAAIRHGTNVEQQVAVPARTGNQRLEALLKGFHVVVRLPGPLFADGDATLPGAVVLELADALFGRVEILRQAVPVVDEDARLQLADHDVHRLRVVVRRGLAQAVEPEDVHRAVVGQQLADLRFQEGQVVRMAVGEGIRMMPVRLRVVEAEA